MVVSYKEVAMFGICLAYIFFGLMRNWRRPKAAQERRPATLVIHGEQHGAIAPTN